ncbi:lipoprotein [Lysinibacillus sphaericus]|nr:hypothetical protein [Lysinibacillus sphaericus]MEB7454708.1 hypothetical protein [Lysinibacillus sphaericus]
MKHPILILTVALLLTGCNEEIKNEPVHPIVQDQMSLLTFFPPDGSIAYF